MLVLVLFGPESSVVFFPAEKVASGGLLLTIMRFAQGNGLLFPTLIDLWGVKIFYCQFPIYKHCLSEIYDS